MEWCVISMSQSYTFPRLESVGFGRKLDNCLHLCFFYFFIFLSHSSFPLPFSSQMTNKIQSEAGQHVSFAFSFLACFCLPSYVEKTVTISAKPQKYIQLELPFSKIFFLVSANIKWQFSKRKPSYYSSQNKEVI